MRIVVVPFAVYDPFFQQVKKGVDAANSILSDKGVKVEWLDIQDVDIENQIGTLNSLCQQKVSGIVLCPIDKNKVSKAIADCVENKIPVATFCLDAPESRRFYHIGQNLRQSGRLAGYMFGRFTGGEGKAGVITGFFNMEGHEERREGFIEVLNENFPDISVAWQEENHDHWEEAYEISRKHITDEADLTGIYVTAGGPFGAAKAAQDLKKGNKLTLVCFDFVHETLEYIKQGTIDASIGQNPFNQGYRSVMAVFENITSGKIPDNEIEHVNLEIAVKENVDYLSEK
jgi:ABC-type sugar transport system substrate-binding protein